MQGFDFPSINPM